MPFFSKKQKEEPQDLEEVLKQFNELKEDFQKISSELAEIKQQNRFNIQKIGIIRFNPFREVGGDQSFSMAFLDQNDCGAVITSYYSRKDNRVYGKPVKAGKSEYALSEEEVSAIEAARNSKEMRAFNGENKNGKKKSNGTK